jgi:hypothetical protein
MRKNEELARCDNNSTTLRHSTENFTFFKKKSYKKSEPNTI